MEIGLLGRRQSGKTTVFNALTGSKIPVAAFSSGKPEPHIIVVNIPDERLEQLAKLYKPKRVIHAQIRFLDLPGIEKPSIEHKQSLPDEQITILGTSDALLIVIRNFIDSSGIEPTPENDLNLIQMELIFSDLVKVEKRLAAIEKTLLKVSGTEREHIEIELNTLKKIKPFLDSSKFIANANLTSDEEKSIRGFQFLTLKPILFLLSSDEGNFDEGEKLVNSLKTKLFSPKSMIENILGLIEMEISALDPESQIEFLKDYHITEPASKRIIRLCYNLLKDITFFTINPNEVHAWTIPANTPAIKAAGAVHSDFEKGFIRAEVIPWDKLVQIGSYSEAKKLALVRTEGKNYIVQDGDVVLILFN